MEKYLMDFFDDIVSGTYGSSGITKEQVKLFVEKAKKDDIERIEELYWEWTSILCDPEDINMNDFTKVFSGVLKK